MKSFLLTLVSVLSLSTMSPLFADYDKRTDGAPGSEWSDFTNWNGRFQLGAEFGALLSNGTDQSSFLLGLDADYRSSDLFGLRFNLNQGVQSPKLTSLSLTPLAFMKYSNLEPYIFAGPGVAIVNAGGTEARFNIVFGAGGDFLWADKYGIGMFWDYNILVDATDFNVLGARLSYIF